MQVPVTNVGGVLIPSVGSHNLLRSSYTSGSSAATYAYLADLANSDSNIVNAGFGVESITNSFVAVPRGFFGICTGESANVPAFGPPSYEPETLSNVIFGIVRSHDTRQLPWADLNPANGVYYWDQIDRWATAHKALGRKLLYTVYQTPSWASTEPNNTGGPYYRAGAHLPPADWGYLSTFISALTQRMRDRGTPIDYYHLCNEPNFVSGNPGRRFYGGTPASLAVMARVVAQAAKPITPEVKIVAPGCTNLDGSNVYGEGTSVLGPPLTQDIAANYFAAMFSASDGAGGGMADWVDMLSFHNYGASATLYSRIKQIKASAATAGLSHLPIIDTEVGWSSNTDYKLFSNIAQVYLAEAAAGIHASTIYAIGSSDKFIHSIKGYPQVQRWLSALIEEVVTHGISGASFLTQSASQGSLAVNINGKIRIY